MLVRPNPTDAEGEAWLEVEDGAGAQPLRQGTFALLPRNARHRLRSDPCAPAPDVAALEREKVSERYEILRHGEGGPLTTLFCGAVRFTHPAARALVDALPASSRSPRVKFGEAGSPGIEDRAPALAHARVRRRPAGGLPEPAVRDALRA